jgi:hypothetical protein
MFFLAVPLILLKTYLPKGVEINPYLNSKACYKEEVIVVESVIRIQGKG